MVEQTGLNSEHRGLRSRDWLLSYKTSSTMIEGRPVDILHDFYIPALSLAVRYDRVAGYFRSSSLAAASQGFSSFVGRGGKMRLIVGADLQPQDVQAVLAGDALRLAARLNQELEQPEAWPESVRSGVSLLAWMVSRDYLEVRVAFRVHGETGKPLSLEAVEDGYVHEKWFILHDAFENRLYGTGALNESKTALVLNAENIEVHCDWWGGIELRRVEEATASFERLWANQVPHVPVLTLPEAVRRRLIQLGEEIPYPVEIDGTSATPKIVPQPSGMERLKFALVKDAPMLPGGRFVGMITAPVAPWPHQEIVARRLVETWPYSYLLCDEVGLGKTIEAGLAFRSLYLSGLARRIFIAAPASLTRQWHRQMASKLLLSFGRVLPGSETRHEYIFPIEEERESTSIYEPDMVIISTGLLARRERQDALRRAKPFDIALVDEAHAARRQNPAKGVGAHPTFGNLYETIRGHLRAKTSSLWLATATPMQIHPVEVCDLLALTNRVGAFQFDPSLTLQYYDLVACLIQRQELTQHDWSFLKRTVQAARRQDPLLWQYLENSVIDGRIRAALGQWMDHGRLPRGGDLALLTRVIFGVSPLSRAMLRHTRRLLEIYRDKGQLQENLPRREILPLPRIVFNAAEQHAYQQLQEYCAGLAEQIRRHGDPQARHAMGFLLSFLRLRFASSLYALRETLKRRLRKVEATLRQQLILEAEANGAAEQTMEEYVYDSDLEDDQQAVEALLKNRSQADLEWEQSQLKAMLRGMADLTGPSSKMRFLLQALDRRRVPQTGRIQQTVIFTRFYDTLTDIVSRLRQVNPQMLIGTYSGHGGEYYDSAAGRMHGADREEVKERFLRGELDLLVCTDAAAEGLNLQTADLLVNFDLGWNPMKIEQRIGRIDRIGQKHERIYVLNLCYADSAEEIVYGRLLSRLNEANLIVGTQQFSLLPVSPEDFQELAEGKVSPEALMTRAQEMMALQRQRSESMEISPEDLYEIYMRRSRAGGGSAAPLNLQDIWEALVESPYLQELGCTIVPETDDSVFNLDGIEGIPAGAALTVSRQLYEEGLAGIQSRLRFASYGEPAFEALLEQMSRFELPPCIKRIAVPVPGKEGMEMVAYVAACTSTDGNLEVRLVTKWQDLQGLNLAEGEQVGEPETEPLRAQLQRLAKEEFNHYQVASRIERENVRAALAQELLSLEVIGSLLEGRGRMAGEGALFWPVLDEVMQLYQDREIVQAELSSPEALSNLASDLLFNINVLAMGTKVYVETTRILAKAASDAARRQAESMKARRADLTVKQVLARLRREAEAKRRQLKKISIL